MISVVDDSEEWKPVVGFESRYEVSNLGRVRALPNRSHRALKIVPQQKTWTGYLYAALRGDGGKDYSKAVHQLVLKAFVGPRPDKMVVCHNNGNKQDNRLSNLRWDTQSNNAKEAYTHGRVPVYGDRHGNTKLKDADVIVVRELLAQGKQGKELAEMFGVSQTTISEIKLGKKRKRVDVS